MWPWACSGWPPGRPSWPTSCPSATPGSCCRQAPSCPSTPPSAWRWPAASCCCCRSSWSRPWSSAGPGRSSDAQVPPLHGRRLAAPGRAVRDRDQPQPGPRHHLPVGRPVLDLHPAAVGRLRARRHRAHLPRRPRRHQGRRPGGRRPHPDRRGRRGHRVGPVAGPGRAGPQAPRHARPRAVREGAGLSLDALPVLPVAVPLLVAAALIGLAPVTARRVADTAAVATAAVVTVSCLALLVSCRDGPVVYWFGEWTPREGIALGVTFAIDPVGAALATLAGALATAALTFSWRIFEAVRTLHHGLMLVFLAGIVGFCLSGDLFNMFVFYELFSVAAYALAGYQTTDPGSVRGALNFAITNSVGAILVLSGIALLYGRTGALNLAQLGQSLATGPADRLVVVAFLLLMVGFFVKAAVVPFHFWLADAYALAPTVVGVIFAGVVLYLVTDGLVKGALFITVGIVDHHLRDVDERRLQGRGRHLLWAGALLVVGAFALAGAPPFGTLLGKALMEEAALEAGHRWLIGLFVVVAALTSAALLRATGRVFLGLGPRQGPAPRGPDEAAVRHPHVHATQVAPAVLLLAAALAIGLAPGLTEAVQKA